MFFYRFEEHFAGVCSGFAAFTHRKEFSIQELNDIVKQAQKAPDFKAALIDFGFKPVEWVNGWQKIGR